MVIPLPGNSGSATERPGGESAVAPGAAPGRGNGSGAAGVRSRERHRPPTAARRPPTAAPRQTREGAARRDAGSTGHGTPTTAPQVFPVSSPPAGAPPGGAGGGGPGRGGGRGRPHFRDLTPLHPRHRIRLESAAGGPAPRIVDLLAPVGKGQRGLIVAPPKTGKTVLLQQLAAAVAENHPECRLMVVLIDERPEEVTEMRRSVRGEVLASTFDRPAKEHIALAELAVERAKRLVEHGQDVVILLDSLTRLCRAHNNAAASGGRTLSGGVDAAALHGPKRLFGAARLAEEGGSLTLLATALVETGSRADDYFFEELKSTGNMELRLDRVLAGKRVYPAVNAAASGTRREELLLPPAELAATRRLRRALQTGDGQANMQSLLEKVRRTPDNATLLRQLQQTAPGA
ncbi:transcription termination factor Rho [Streptomyces libani]|uniref:transcription termination factor Rho n=1 Tax=Streptomyces nigrescens TaxID=1920 RepID=UPI0036A6E36C